MLSKREVGSCSAEVLQVHHFPTWQLDALLAVMHGKDVFVRMATGAGKSLCMFLAPLALSETAVGVVISPLNCLMEQQV